MKSTLFLSMLLLVLFGSCHAQVITANENINSPETMQAPYVVMVSLDGFRHDYAAKFGAINLLKMAADGLSTPAMIPSFPTKTFPNHYSLVTGMYPGTHGIVSNEFYDPERDRTYRVGNREAVQDSSWYGGTPLWVLAEKQGMKSASYFWVGSEAPIQGIYPSYYSYFDDKVPHSTRINQAIDWLKLPPAKRPHFITLYFSPVDTEGHRHGPDSDEVAAAVRSLDAELGILRQRLDSLGLPLTLIITSDHGMTPITGKDPIILSELIALDKWKMASTSNILLMYNPKPEEVEAAYATLARDTTKFFTYKKGQLPAQYHFGQLPVTGDLVLVAKPPYSFRKSIVPPQAGGDHGYPYDICPDMGAIFYAVGPRIAPREVAPSFESVHVYPFVAGLLGLKITDAIDGKAEVLAGYLKKK